MSLSILADPPLAAAFDAAPAISTWPETSTPIDERRLRVPADWRGRHGGALGGEDIVVRAVGACDRPSVLLLGGISAGRFATAADDGWCGHLARAGGGLDLEALRVISFDYPPEHSARPTALAPEDFAELIALGLDALGAERLDAAVGYSFGGMVALAFARRFPERIGKLCVVSAAHRPHPMATAWRHVQRGVLDLAEKAGDPAAGVALARALGMTTYRTPEEFRDRFAGAPGLSGGVVDYLDARGRDYAEDVSAARYATLSAAIDRHAEDPAAITTPTFAVAVDSDRLQPPGDVAELVANHGGRAVLHLVRSRYGHDAFLKDANTFAPLLTRFLEGDWT